MKKTILALALLTLTSHVSYSEEAEQELMEASADYVMLLLESCKEFAQEDEITQSDMNGYLVTCINEELASSFYKTITVLPKE